jgi:outer membrane protein assembly factor BamB
MICGLVAQFTAAAEPTPETEWLIVEEGSRQGLSNPVVVDGLVVVGSDAGLVRALNAQTGEEIWRYAHAKRIYTRPEFDDKRIFAISEFDGMIALDRRNGSLVWSQPSQLGYGALAICPEANLLLLAGNDGVVRALEAPTGRERWAVNLLDDAPRDPPGFDGNRARFQGKPARPSAATCDGKWVFISVFDQSRVVAFDIADGTKRFDYQARGWIHEAALVDGDRVFIGSQDRALHCVERATSEFIWSHQTNGRIESSAAVNDEKVYFGSCDGGFYCIDRETGDELWKFDVQTDGQRTTAIYSKPLILNDTVCFAAGEGQVYALELDSGKLRWKLRPLDDSELFTSPASDGRFVFVTSRPRFNNMGQVAAGKAALIAIDPYFQVIDPFATKTSGKGP